jgi:hypothetical protein
MILAVAVLGAVLIGLVRGGSLRRLASLPLRGGWVAILAFGLQIYLIYFPEPASEGVFSPRVGLLVLSYGLLLFALWENRQLPGVPLIAGGVLANLFVMAANGGYMPIAPEALEQVGHSRRVLAAQEGARVMATKDVVLPHERTVAWWLADIFVIPPPFPVPSVFSAGDVLIALGVFWLLQACMCQAPKGQD